MRAVLTRKVTIEEVIKKVEAKLQEVDLIEEAMNLTRQELTVVQGRIEISWQMVKLRVGEMRALIGDLKAFLSHGPNEGESEE